MQDHAHHHFAVQVCGPVTHVTLTHRDLDDPNALALALELFALAERLGGGELCLDLKHVEYLSSTAMSKFMALHNKIKADGGRLSIIKVDPTLYELFSLARLTSVLDVRRKEGAAAPPTAA
jgi:anti-anti-sigma factor